MNDGGLRCGVSACLLIEDLWRCIVDYRKRHGTVPSRILLGREEWGRLLVESDIPWKEHTYVAGVLVLKGDWQ